MSAYICRTEALLHLLRRGFFIYQSNPSMSRPKDCVASLPAIYRADTFDKILYGFVQGYFIGHADVNGPQDPERLLTICQKFIDFYGLEDCYTVQSALNCYCRYREKAMENRGIGRR
jgi:ribulose bisphosphate carboxylase small subunit